MRPLVIHPSNFGTVTDCELGDAPSGPADSTMVLSISTGSLAGRTLRVSPTARTVDAGRSALSNATLHGMMPHSGGWNNRQFSPRPQRHPRGTPSDGT